MPSSANDVGIELCGNRHQESDVRGPVGQFAIRSCFLLGAERVIAIDNIPERMEMARAAGAETLNDEDDDLQERITSMTDGRGPDHCIDAVGLEAHGKTLDALYDRVKVAVMLETDRSHATNCG
jgi:threonine dehydrogenase-like Zn-dependent dehydrogenase